MSESTFTYQEPDNSSESQKPSILDLDDDCLINIFEFLSIYELIDAEKVCDLFKATSQRVYASKRFHRIRIELRNLQTEYFKDIFEKIGNSLRAFEFSGGYIMDEVVKQTMIDGVTESCSKLKSLSINYVQFSIENFRQLQESFCNLTCLDLSRCGISESSLDNLELDGERFKSIKTLKLAGNSCMIGSFFKNMSHVESLDVSYCYYLTFFEFSKFLKNCQHLIELNVSASCQLVTEDENFLEILHSHQPNLEKLIMNNTGIARDDEVMMKFKKLKFASFEGRRFGT
jgi:hypothetical protein